MLVSHYLTARVVVRIEELAGLELCRVEGTFAVVISAPAPGPARRTASLPGPSSCSAAGRSGHSATSRFAGEFFGALRVKDKDYYIIGFLTKKVRT